MFHRAHIFSKLGGIFTRNITTVSSHRSTSHIISPACLNFLDNLHQQCSHDYNDCISMRNKQFNAHIYNFRDETKTIRTSNWKVDKYDSNLDKRYVELTGPANSKKMVINAFNSNANGYMADLEDSMTPSWKNIIDGHSNIKHAVRNTLYDVKYNTYGQISKEYSIQNENPPTFFVRPRGLHMKETNVVDSDNNPIPATIFDIGLHLFNNGRFLYENNQGPYLYIPKLESYEDAKLINKIITISQDLLNIPQGTTKTTVLIETFPAIFQVDEIIYGLKDHISGINCGRWDYLFSMIKCLGNDYILPDREKLTMDKSFLEAYVKQIVYCAHKRGIHAMGGMSAFIPTNNTEKNNEIFKTIKKDKLLEIHRGCDGAWVAHPGLIENIQDIFSTEHCFDDEADAGMHQVVPMPPAARARGRRRGICDKKLDKDIQSSLVNISSDDTSLHSLKNNINVSLQYISAWLSGNGAVALNNQMEDLATAEISIHQIKQWFNAGIHNLDCQFFEKLLQDEYIKILDNNEVEYAQNYFNVAKQILREYVYSNNAHFLPDIASKYLEKDFQSIVFDDHVLNKLSGSKGYLTGVELTKHRGNFLNKFLYDDHNPAYKFLGTSNGVSAVNVVSGGNGQVGPYAGGWQTNAMKNRLGMLLPDTLHVSPEEAANCAEEINNHLIKADCIQHLQQISDASFAPVNYHDIALLADMEQGWNTPEKIRISVKKAIENGVNVIHIEDQGEKKRCGHLGDKELNTYDDFALILKSANLAAQEILGKEQASKQYVRFVARTDAYSAKRIVASRNLYDSDNDEYKFIDWDRGTTDDGKYLYLRQGINPVTSRSWGLDLSIERGIKVVDQGLASHLWMETPDADLTVAKAFIDGVNKMLIPKGKKAYGLYNHSPSFDWDVKFFAEAEPIAEKIAKSIKNQTIEYANSFSEDFLTMNRILDPAYIDGLQDIVRKTIIKEGSDICGDHLFTNKNIDKITNHCIDYIKGKDYWKTQMSDILNQSKNIHMHHDIYNLTLQAKQNGFAPIKYITDIIVDQRLSVFSRMLASFGFNMHLITLPEFHITAFNMYKLSNDFSTNGINAFVKYTQRPERILSENDPKYTYYKHQTATGTGIEAEFSKAVGVSNVNILADSTENDDFKKRS